MNVKSFTSHTLFDPEHLLFLNKDQVPGTYKSFCSLVKGVKVEVPLEAPAQISNHIPVKDETGEYDVPTLLDMGYKEIVGLPTPFHGGESEGLKRLQMHMNNKRYIAEFEKPNKPKFPRTVDDSFIALEVWLRFLRLFYHELLSVYKQVKSHSQPPVSLVGQLYFREYFYLNGYGVPNFDKMIGNPRCVQIPWIENAEHLAAWENGDRVSVY